MDDAIKARADGRSGQLVEGSQRGVDGHPSVEQLQAAHDE